MPPYASGADGRPPILVVEDELVLALELESALDDAGYAVIGPAATLRDAAALLRAARPAAALLDVNIQGHPVVPLARRLVAAGVPFALHTAYAADHLAAPILRGAPLLPKPLDQAALRRVLRDLVAPE